MSISPLLAFPRRKLPQMVTRMAGSTLAAAAFTSAPIAATSARGILSCRSERRLRPIDCGPVRLTSPRAAFCSSTAKLVTPDVISCFANFGPMPWTLPSSSSTANSVFNSSNFRHVPVDSISSILSPSAFPTPLIFFFAVLPSETAVV